MSLYDKPSPSTVTTRPNTTAILAINSADRDNPDVSEQQNFTSQRYNDFVITKNQNLLQGAFTRVQLTEIRFPYAIPNINTRNNKVFVIPNSTNIDDVVEVEIPEGFYTGSELATALQTQIIADCSGTTGIDLLEVTYNETGAGEFKFSMPSGSPTFTLIFLPYSTEQQPDAYATWGQTNQLMKTIGLDILSASTNLVTYPIIGGSAPMLYTDYIDIVSEQLTNYQRVKDGNTASRLPRQAIIERLYITDESSQNDPTTIPGTYPFTIMRQINTPKTIRWSGEHAIGQIDIKLYDMYGQPLYLPQTIINSPDITAYFGSITNKLSYKIKSKKLKSGDTVYTVDTPLPNFQLTFLASEE